MVFFCKHIISPHRNHAVEVSLKKMTAEGVVNKYPGLGYSVVVKLKFPRATQILEATQIVKLIQEERIIESRRGGIS